MSADGARADLPASAVEADENDIYTEGDLKAALVHFRNAQEALERNHFNQYVTIDIATGRMAVAATRLASVAAYAKQFGPSKTLTIHIGTTK